MGLKNYIEGGVALDARVSYDLLMSIFNPASPLHDGAVVIRGGRIRYASAVLPVSQTRDLPKAWGTRHRAGVGITEISDAECIIISEERREVLLASRGKVERKQGKDHLKKEISAFEHSRGKKDEGKRLPQNVLHDLPRKTFFLFGVCLLWIVVIGIRQGEVSFNIPIEYYSIPQNLTIAGESPKEVNVRFRGSQKLLSSLNQDHLRVQIGLSNAHTGTNQISLSVRDIDVPSGITVTGFSPRKITLQLSQAAKDDKK